MCGRFTLTSPADAVAAAFDLIEVADLTPRYNIAPTQSVAAVIAQPANGGIARELRMLHWGLIPFWAKDRAIGNRMINARGETLAEKPSFRAALKSRRCLIAADGFFEWKKSGDGKQPYFIHMKDGSVFGFAGLWERWTSPEGEEVQSCTIITTDPNKVSAQIHDRMPAIIAPEDYDHWLDPAAKQANEVLPLIGPYDDSAMEAYAVSKIVNKPGNDVRECVEPV